MDNKQNRIQIRKIELDSLPIKDIDEYLKEYDTQYDYLLFIFLMIVFSDAKKILENQEIISLLSNDDVDSLLEIEKRKIMLVRL